MTVDPEKVLRAAKARRRLGAGYYFSKDASECDGQPVDGYALGTLDEALALAGPLGCGTDRGSAGYDDPY